MNLRKIIDMVCDQVDDTIEDKHFVGWVHSAQVNIAKEYGRIVKWEVYALKNLEEPLPNNFLKLAEIYDDDGKEVNEFIITPDGHIAFKSEGLYYVHYHRTPDPPPDEEDDFFDDWEPECHEIFHPTIILWCKAEYWDLESDSDREESGFADKFRQRFYREVRDAAQLLEDRALAPKQKIDIDTTGWF